MKDIDCNGYYDVNDFLNMKNEKYKPADKKINHVLNRYLLFRLEQTVKQFLQDLH